MNNLDYYKSLISDDEVITALVRQSRVREGELEKSRVRPNMNFFQRTVSNMVSSNQRITTRQERKIAEEKKKNASYKSKKYLGKKRTARELINEILTSQTKFIPSTNPEEMSIDTQSDKNTPENTKQQTEINNKYSETLLISSDEEFTKHVGKVIPTEIYNHPIQISSDEGNIDIETTDDTEYYYKKKKCKRRHQFTSKKNKT